ncbi:peroxiredoxin-like family protein [Elongatibacter sediminis]|uniref:thioredoxin-dependent peroxiredoxin n=1 Tax=Elongatibacter sediminis TaxID=3119006 RepID=A0AAW9RHB5_9GAMM
MTRTSYLLLITVFLQSLMIGGLMAEDSAPNGRGQIYEQAADVQPLLPGMKAPAFELRDAAGKPVSFDPDALAAPAILTFFRGGWCPYCNLHLAELRHAEAELEQMGYDLWFISMDRPELLYASLEDPGIGYTVYSDARLEAVRAFGIGYRMDEQSVERYRQHGLDLEEVSGESHHVLPAPSTFLVGTDGVIRFQYTNPDYQVRLHPDVLLAAARVNLEDQDERLKRARKSGKQ